MNNILELSVESIKGSGKKTIGLLAELEIYSIKDLLYNVPYRISNSTDFSSSLGNNTKVTTVGIVETAISTQFYGKRSRSFFSLQTSNGSVKVIFFNQSYLKKSVVIGRKVLIKGIYNSSNNTITSSSISTNFQEEDVSTRDRIEVFYHLKQGISQKKYVQLVQTAFAMIDENNKILDIVPKNFKGILPLGEILYNLHFPKSVEIFDKVKKMFVFHELFDYQMKLQLQGLSATSSNERYSVNIINHYVDEFISTLSFNLTNSQKKVINEIIEDIRSSNKMNRLLQGDVGSGKTVVAAATLYAVVKSGYQTAIMAPTEILAIQHFETMYNFFSKLDVSIALLTSSTPKKERTKILNLLVEGNIDIIVGTHSLIQDDVKFKQLKYVITDEQHRFGVNQRKLLSEKGQYVNSLMMTATPIPRSLAITLITNMKVSTIDELPAGRKKVKTLKATNKEFYKVMDNIKKELDKGNQVYVVCPLIEESEKIDLKNVEEIYQNITDYFKNEVAVGILHGKMPNKEKEEIVDKFSENKISILISTTVIEVGVNVPNATVMLVVDAHRFGLATLHQLRGRVGRSDKQSYCILLTDSKSERIDVMCLENDGFKIAEFDLKQRGPGDFFGTKQSGVPSFKVADLINDVDLMYLAKRLATKLIEATEDLSKLKKYLGLKENLD